MAASRLVGMAGQAKKTQDEDERWMRRAITLAKRGQGKTGPNPCVGAVIVQDGKKVAEGWHEKAGFDHAEVVALKAAAAAGKKVHGATLYVTLEPCAAAGKTPACTDAILRAGIWRVVYASGDPNPKMAGGGELLKAHGVDVTAGVLAEKADALNPHFFHFARTGMPYVILKAAVSLDGKLATRRNQSQWISGEESRLQVQKLRAESDAIMVGAATLRSDNPSLTVRGIKLKKEPPLRVIACFDTPPYSPDYKILDKAAPTRMYVRANNAQSKLWREAGIQVVVAPTIIDILKHLAEHGCLQLLVEGGGMLFSSFLEARLADELVMFQAPMLIGGRDAPGIWHGQGVDTLRETVRLSDVKRRKMGDDQMIRGLLTYPE